MLIQYIRVNSCVQIFSNSFNNLILQNISACHHMSPLPSFLPQGETRGRRSPKRRVQRRFECFSCASTTSPYPSGRMHPTGDTSVREEQISKLRVNALNHAANLTAPTLPQNYRTPRPAARTPALHLVFPLESHSRFSARYANDMLLEI